MIASRKPWIDRRSSTLLPQGMNMLVEGETTMSHIVAESILPFDILKNIVQINKTPITLAFKLRAT